MKVTAVQEILRMLQELLDSLPPEHQDRPGIMRSIELIRVEMVV